MADVQVASAGVLVSAAEVEALRAAGAVAAASGVVAAASGGAAAASAAVAAVVAVAAAAADDDPISGSSTMLPCSATSITGLASIASATMAATKLMSV
jgi:hypothetical protein